MKYATWWYILWMSEAEVRVFKTKEFTRFARKSEIDDEALCEAIARAERGLIDADLKNGLIKQRIARKGRGKSGGFRTIIAYKIEDKSIFMYGFAKNEQTNVSAKDLAFVRTTAKELMDLDEDGFELALDEFGILELDCDDQEI